MRARLVGLLALCAVGALAAPARAQLRRPELLRPERGFAGRAFVGLENDHLLFGLWRVIDPDSDGDDTGRTHALDVQVALTRPDGLSVGLQIESTLFLTDNGRPRRVADEDGNFLFRDDGGQQGYLVDDVFVALDGWVVPREALRKTGPRTYVDPQGNPVLYRPRTFVDGGREVQLDLNTARRVIQRTDLPVDFRELTFLRLFVDDRASPRPLYWRASFGPVFSNGRRVTAGGTGQQRVWHWLIDWRQYDYRASDAANGYGVSGAGEVGLDVPLVAGRSARLFGTLAGGAELVTLPEGSRGFGLGQLALELGAAHAPWGELRVTQEAHLWLALGEVTATSRASLAVHAGPVSIYLRLNLYWGGLANGWFEYNRNRPTTDGGLELRF